MAETTCEFRLIQGSSRDADRFLFRCDMSSVPVRGERIGVNGHPYVVCERSWAIGTPSHPSNLPQRPSTIRDTAVCYLRLVSHHGNPP